MADEIRLPVSADTTQMERNIAEATRRVGTINLNANIDSRGLESLSRPLGRITGQADEFSKSMEAANARVLAFGASVGVINAIGNAFKNLVKSTIEVEKSLTEIKIIGNETFSDLSKTSSGLFSTAKQLGVSYKDAADATLEFARQGKGLTESLNASKAALALTRTAGISATEAVMGLTSAVNAFGRGAEGYIEYANKMSAVSDAFAVNNKDLIEGLSRSASVAQEAGVSFEQLTALIATLQEKTGRGGAVIGNALKTIFTRVQNPEIIKDLRDLGISVQDAATGNFLPATQIIQNLANEFQSFDKNLRNSVLLKVGGGFQVDKLAAVLNDVKDASGTYQRALNIATSGSGDILGRVAKLNQTIDSSFTNLLTSSKQLGSNIGQIAFSKDFSNLLQNGASLISSINDAIFGGGKDAEDQGSAIGKAVLKGIGSVISGPGLALFAGILAKLSLDFAKFSTSGLQTLLGITSKSKEEQLIQNSISTTLSKNAEFQKLIFNLEGNRVAQAELLLNVIRQQVNEAKKLEDISKGAAAILYERGVRVSGATPQIKNSAEGYIPNLVTAIAKEKSESPAGSRIIVDRNFPMGGGQRSTMVYNSNETRIRNFGGTGGDAIIPNYPINSAKGFTPNFAEPKRKVLDIDASRASVAGLTFAGENEGVLDKTKPITIDDNLLGKYSGSPFLGILKEFEALKLVNLPVGNVYKFRKGLQGEEKQIKKDFIDKLNLKFRDQIISFLKEEITGLGMATGGGVDENLSKLKLNVIGPSTAGYIFEEILKIPTLTNAEKVAQYANQSDTDFFDIRGLKANFAEAYGLPKRDFDLAEIKFGQKELFDGISKKFLNEVIFQGGGADPKKFGVKDTNRAARGYIPNFANLGIAAYQPVMAGRVFEALVKKQNYVDLLENSIYPDFGEYEIKGSLKAALNDKNFGYGRPKGRKLIVPGDADRSLLDQLEKEKFAQVIFSNITNQDTQPIAREMIKKYGDPKYIGSLNKLKLIYPNNKNNIKAASEGYIPNFANVNADILTVNPAAASLSIDQFIEKYIGKPYSTGLSGTSGAALKLQRSPIEIREAKRDFIMSMLGPNFLATFNKDKSAQASRDLLIENKARFGSARRKVEGGGFLQKKYGEYSAVDYSNVVEGKFSGNVKELQYESLDELAEKVFQQKGLNPIWEEIVGIMSEFGRKAELLNADYNQQSYYFNNPETGKTESTSAKNRIKQLTAKLQPDLIKGLLEDEKNIGGLLVNIPKYDQNLMGKDAKYLVPLDPAAISLKKYISDYLINKNLNPLNPESREASETKSASRSLFEFLDEYSPEQGRRKGVALTTLKSLRERARANFQLRQFLGESVNQGAFEVKKNQAGSLSGFWKQAFPQNVVDRMASVLTEVYRADGIYPLSNLDFGYTGFQEVKEAVAQSVPNSVKYGDYKNNKAYYDSIAKWKYDAVSKSMIRQAASGFIPNFSDLSEELTGSGSGMLYSNPNFNEIGGGQSGKFLAPKSGEGFGQKIFYKLGKDESSTAKIKQEYNVNKAIKEFEKSNPDLFKKNAVSFTNVGKLLTQNGLLAGFERQVLTGASIDDFSSRPEFKIKDKGVPDNDITPRQNFAFGLSELMAQVGIKNVIEKYRERYGKDSISIDDIYAQNFKVNDAMQKYLIEETNKFFEQAKEQKIKGRELSSYVDNYILRGGLSKEQVASMNQAAGSIGGLHTMFDTQGVLRPATSASKGYVPNFAYNLGANKDNIAIRSVTAPFDEQGNRIRGSGAVKEAILAAIERAKSKGFTKISADIISDASLNAFTKYFGSAVKGKNVWNISDFKNANKGYIPNFAGGAIDNAIMREKMQSGLPSSQISITQDSRLANNLNPSGFAVINKRDEPNGKVPTNRIADAYKNANRGFIPNFATDAVKEFAAASAGLGSNEGAKLARQLESFTKVLENQIKDFYTSGDEVQKLNNAIKTYRQEVENYTKLNEDAQKSLKELIAIEARLDSEFNKLESLFSKAENIYAGNSAQSPIVRLVGPPPASFPPPFSSSITSGANSGNKNAQPNTQSATLKAQEDKSKKADKSLGDLAQTAFIFQSGLSFATGALSTFGKEAEALGDVLNSIGQIGYSITQGGDLFKQLTKGRGLGDLISSVRRGAEIGTGGTTSTMSRLRGGLRGALVGTAAVEGGAAATGLGAGSVGGALMAGGALAAGVAAGGYLLYKSIDSIGKFMNGAATRTERAVNAFNDIQEKYNVQLSDKQKVTVDRLSELADVSGTSLSGAAVGSGFTFSQKFRSLKASLGFKDETYKNLIQQQIANSGLNLTEEGNQALAKSLGPLLAPIVTEATNKRGENGLIITAPQDEQDRLIAELFSQKLKRIDEILKEELKKPQVFSEEEIQKIIKEKNLKETIEKRRPSFEEMKKMTLGEQMSLQDTGGFIYEKKSAKDKAKEVLKERRISDVTQIAAARAAQETAPESIAAQATLEAQKQAILIQTELLKKRLEITQQIAKIESTIPSALESSLSIQKELLSTNEADKFALDLRLKNLQEERQVRAEIKDLFSTEARDIISKNLDRTAALGVTTPRAQQITGLFDNLQAAQNVEDQKKAYSEIINQLDLSVSRQLAKIESLKIENEELETSIDLNSELIKFNNEEIQQLSAVNEQLQQRTKILQGNLDIIIKQSEARKIQTAQAAQERAITEKSNYYYTLQKDIFSAQIEIQNKKLEKTKQELDLRRQMRDIAFQEMQFADKTKTEPRKQYEAGIFAARTKEQDSVNDAKMRNREKMQAYRQSLYNEISNRTNNLQTMSKASKAAISGDTKELEKLYAQAFGEQAQTFDQKVLTAAEQFAQIVVQSAKDSEAIKRGEKQSTSYQSISSGKSIEEILKTNYKDYKNQTDISKDIEKLRTSSLDEASAGIGSDVLNSKISELENILQKTSAQAAEAKRQSILPVTEDITKEAEKAARRRKIEEDVLSRAEYERTTFKGGMEASKREINREIEEFNAKLGREIPLNFRDSMSAALRELSNTNSTEPLKQRLLSVANSFLEKILEGMRNQIANEITSLLLKSNQQNNGGGGSGGGGFLSSLFGGGANNSGFNSGGSFASGGKISGGSGNKDDVPALLMGGEYVIKKSAVNKYGTSFLDSLNEGKISKYADGGRVFDEFSLTKENYEKYKSTPKFTNFQDQDLSFNQDGSVIDIQNYTGKDEAKSNELLKRQTAYYKAKQQTGEIDGFFTPGKFGYGAIIGQKNLLSFATQQSTSSRFDKIYGSSNKASLDLAGGSENLTTMGFRNEINLKNTEVEEAKRKAADLYFQGQNSSNEKARMDYENQKEYERQLEEIRKRYEEEKKRFRQNLIMVGIGGALQGFGGVSGMSRGLGSVLGGLFKSGSSSTQYSSSGSGLRVESLGSKLISEGPSDTEGPPTYTWMQQYSRPSIASSYAGRKYASGGIVLNNKNINFSRYASGGMVQGNGYGDNVPSLLTGGEFVINKDSAQKIGYSNLNNLNSGNLNKSAGSFDTSRVEQKLEELIQKITENKEVPNISIVVNSDKSETEKNTNNNSERELAKRIKNSVMQILAEEKRLGGLLR